jgi:hypothetical protein
MTSLLRGLNEEYGIPLSTRELNLISYGSVGETRDAEVMTLGEFVLRLLRGGKVRSISFSD